VFDFLNGPVRELVTAIYEAVGYLGVALWVAVESVIIPIPSELVLPFAGFLAAQPDSLEPITGAPWSIPLLVTAATVGSLIGALVAYAIGYWGGRPLLVRWGKYLRFTEADLDHTERFFERWGAWASFLGRMIPVVRSLVSFGAGVGRMHLGPFILFTILGSIPWNLALVLAGYLLGENWLEIGSILKRYEYLVLGILVVIGLVWIWFRYVKPWRAGRHAIAATEDASPDA
jgi:membrane protein DedA with SNARE-associated domain